MQLKEESSVRERVLRIQKNLSLMLRAMGDMATANPVFAHSQLPSLVAFLVYLLTKTSFLVLLHPHCYMVLDTFCILPLWTMNFKSWKSHAFNMIYNIVY